MSEIGRFDGDMILDQLRRDRRMLHKTAELSGKEVKTQAFLEESLLSVGIRSRRIGTGLTADLKGNSKHYVAFRADMDALPITETEKPYQSASTGISHMCGHDGHMAVLLSVASILSSIPPRQRPSVRLIFQPSEECGGGAQSMVDHGALDNVKLIFGLHLCPEEPIGTIATIDGGMFAGTVDYRLDFFGRVGHIGDEGMTDSALLAASQFVTALERLYVEKYAATCKHGIGQFRSGSAHNIVSPEASLAGTFRYYDETKKEAYFMDLERELIRIENETGVQHRFVPFGVYPPLVNSPELAGEVAALVGAKECKPRFTAEDFAVYLNYSEGVFFWLGTGTEKCNSPLHSPSFDFDEKALVSGVKLMTELLDAIADGRVNLE